MIGFWRHSSSERGLVRFLREKETAAAPGSLSDSPERM
jgi:hypothetical protein